VQYVVRTLIEHGHHPAIAMRGYKAKPGQMSDEESEHASVLEGVPIVAQPDRAAGLHALFKSEPGEGVDCVILDDGFQHRKIARDLDVVLIDASRPPSRDALLPLGHLRERAESLSRADVIVITHSEMVEQDDLGALRSWINSVVVHEPLIVVTEHSWISIDKHNPDGVVISESVGVLKEMRVATLTGIGHPNAFIAMTEEAGAQILHRCDGRDHESFTEAMLARFVEDAQGSDGILMTAKDWCRLESAGIGGKWSGGIPVYVPRLGVQFRSGEQRFVEACLRVTGSR
jgi:tetraacyldisaccharide 4'-kinase